MIGLELACNMKNISQKEIAAKLNITATNISSWFKETRSIPNKYLEQLSDMLDGIPSNLLKSHNTELNECKIRIFFAKIEGNNDELRYYQNKVNNLIFMEKVNYFLDTKSKKEIDLLSTMIDILDESQEEEQEATLFQNNNLIQFKKEVKTIFSKYL
jgi:transcriptional regulator with XRE-family HTH domain